MRSTRPVATARRYRLRLVTHDPVDFDRFYNQFANPALWFLQHELWELAGEPRLDEAWESYRRVNEAIAGAVIEELAADADRPVWFHDYHLYVAPPLVRAAVPRGSARALRPHPLARPGCVGRAAGRVRPARSTKDCWRTTWSGSTHNAGARTSSPRSRLFSAPTSTSTRNGRVRRAQHPRHRAPDLGRHRRVRRAGRPRRRARPGARSRADPQRSADPEGRSHRSVQEHRPRLRGIRGVPRRASGSARAGRDARAARSRRGRTSRSTRPTWTRSAPPRARSTIASPGMAGTRWLWRCGTTSRARSPRTRSTTCCSSTRSPTG